MPKCSAEAGLVPCQLTKTKKVTDEASLYYYMHDMISHVKPRCNTEWNVKIDALLQRFKGAVICDSYKNNNQNIQQGGQNQHQNYQNGENNQESESVYQISYNMNFLSLKF